MPIFLKKTLSLLLLYFGSNVCHFYVGTYFSFRNYLSFVRCVGLRICITAAAAIAIACPHISSILAMTKLLLPIRNSQRFSLQVADFPPSFEENSHAAAPIRDQQLQREPHCVGEHVPVRPVLLAFGPLSARWHFCRLHCDPDGSNRLSQEEA